METVVANLVIATILAVLAAVVTRGRYRTLAYSLWLLVLVKLVTPAGYQVPLPSMGNPIPLMGQTFTVGRNPSNPFTSGSENVGPTKVEEIQSRTVGGLSPIGGTVPQDSGKRHGEWQWRGALLLLWGMGSLSYLFLTVFRLCRFRRVVRQASVESLDLSREAALALPPAANGRLPLVMVVDASIAPMLWPGVFRPTIYLPKALVERLSNAERRDLLAHEMAHFRRRDPWRRWFETVVVAVYWWWPIAWWARRELESLEDECCDMAVLSRPGASNKQYAQLLLKTVDFLSEHSLPVPKTACGFGQSPSASGVLNRRVKNILGRIEGHPMGWTQWIVITLILGLVYPISGVSPVASSEEVPEAAEAAEGVDEPGDFAALPGNSISYPWIEQSPVQRVPKGIVEALGLYAIKVDSSRTFNFVLTKRFIGITLLTPDQVEAVNAAIARTVHEYRLLEQANLRVTDQPPPRLPARSRREGAVAESYSFQLNPFPDEAAPLRERLADELRHLIGPTRGQMVVEQVAGRGELRMMRPPSRRRPDARPQSFLYVYHYENDDPPYVRFSRFSGSGGGGLPLSPALDRYAPVELQATLKRWRNTIADAVGGEESVVKNTEKEYDWDLPTVAWPLALSSHWVEEAPFLDIDKRLLIHLQVAARDLDGFSPTAASLLGLNEEQQQGILNVYDRMADQFLEIQYRHFRDVDPERGQYRILAFPEEADRLAHQWREEIEAIIGTLRAEIIDRYVRIPLNDLVIMKRGKTDPSVAMRFLRRRVNDLQWLEWGRRGVEIELDVFDDEQGRKRVDMEYRIEGGGSGSSSGALLDGLPMRFRDPLLRRFEQASPPKVF